MSFFGNVTYKLAKAFDRIGFKNGGRTSTTRPAEAGTIEWTNQAGTENDELYLDTGNKWIQIRPGAEPTIAAFYHSLPDGQISGKYDGFVVDSSRQSSTISLSPGDQIKTNSIQIDEAGHIVNATETYYKLPETASDIDFNNIVESLNATSQSENAAGYNVVNQVFTNRDNISSARNNYNTLNTTVNEALSKRGQSTLVTSLTTAETNINNIIGRLSTIDLAIEALRAKVVELENNQ